jgi:NitT/TauT family transport system substrate-binding protein
MNNKLNETISLYDSGNSIGKFYAERGVISEYPDIENIVDPRFVKDLMAEKNLQ